MFTEVYTRCVKKRPHFATVSIFYSYKSIAVKLAQRYPDTAAASKNVFVVLLLT